MEYQNLKFLQETFLETRHLCSFTLTEDFQLLYSNCPEQEFFYNLFSVSQCGQAILNHFSRDEAPILASDSIGFVWGAVRQHPDNEDQIPLLHLIGPLFISEMTEAHLRQRIRKLHSTPDFENRLSALVKTVPTLLTDTAISFAGMLHYCLNGTAVKPESIVFWNEDPQKEEEVSWGDTRWHGTWIGEQRFFQSVVEGRADGIRELSVGKIGEIGGQDPLRQAKNETIVFTVLCSRAAILGGVSSEGALNLSDYYLSMIEEAQTVPEVYNIGAALHRAYIDRVQKARANKEKSPLIRACLEYVETHIFDRIRVSDIAEAAGYTENYISRSFKSEMGISLFSYINKRKIETAKNILADNTISVAELSDRLSFSNPSYFTSVFKKVTGLTPGEYQGKVKAPGPEPDKNSTT